MKEATKNLFSVSVEEFENTDYKQDKFEVVSCPRKEMKCNKQLSVINTYYNASEHFHREKDYQNSIESLQNAFYKTLDLNDQPCARCAALFRSVIIESVENKRNELYKMTKGFFGNKHYQPGLLLSEKVLSELKKVETYQNLKKNEDKQLYIQGVTQKKVS